MLSLRSGVLVALIALLLGFYLRHKSNEDLLLKLQLVADGMRSAEVVRRANASEPVRAAPRVAVGLGSCMDVFIRAEDFFKELTGGHNTLKAEQFEHIDEIRTRDDLLKMFGYFFSKGAAAERYIRNATLWQEILTVVNSPESKLPGLRWVTGGNGPVIGARLAREGAQVLIGAGLSPRAMAHLPAGVTATSQLRDGEEDVHILLEYEVGDEFAGVTAPRANRFIMHRDRRNPALSDLRDFEEGIAKFKPDLVVMSGLQMLDGFPFRGEELQRGLERLSSFMRRLGPRTRVHFEMASFADRALMQGMLTHVLPFSDSLGMNEQELPNLVSALETGEIVRLSNAYPRVAVMLDAVRRLLTLMSTRPAVNGQRRVSRVHLHTLGFQALVVRTDGSWANTMAAAAHSALMAHRHTCGVAQVDIARSKLLMDQSFAVSVQGGEAAKRVHFNATHPVRCWKEPAADADVDAAAAEGRQLELCVAPGLVCTKVVQTTGGGDNISGAGLWPQL